MPHIATYTSKTFFIRTVGKIRIGKPDFEGDLHRSSFSEISIFLSLSDIFKIF